MEDFDPNEAKKHPGFAHFWKLQKEEQIETWALGTLWKFYLAGYSNGNNDKRFLHPYYFTPHSTSDSGCSG